MILRVTTAFLDGMGLVCDTAGNDSLLGIRIALHMIRYNYE
jgi:hypothetical protein